MHVAEAKKQIGSRFNWLCDTMSNDLKHALGNAPNSEFIIDPKGKIIVARQWSRPDELREDLIKLIGPVDQPTSAADLGMKPPSPAKQAAKGIVPRVQLPGRMTAVKAIPQLEDSRMPFYVKLRAEIEPGYFSDGAGKLYLGFFLDPLHKVHWNNRAAPIQYEISAPPGVAIAPTTGKGPDVEADADSDPREFLAEVSGRSEQPIELTVKYFACDDAETFCAPVTQQYHITLEADRDGGSRRAAGQRRGGDRGRMPMAAGPGSQDSARGRRPSGYPLFQTLDEDHDGTISATELARAPILLLKLDRDKDGRVSREEMRPASAAPSSRRPFDGTTDFAQRFRQLDRNRDGKLTKDELPEQMLRRFDMMDTNGDGAVDQAEQAATIRRIEQGRRQP
jgi:hypothetical protein